MLKGARERAESFDRTSANASPRLRPLLAPSPHRPSGAAYLPDAGDVGPSVVTAQPERQQSLNYQGTAQTDPIARRRSAPSRKSTGLEPGQVPSREGGTREREPDELRREPRWKRSIRYFKSIELENKGSVARDHLALGAAIFGSGCDSGLDTEADWAPFRTDVPRVAPNLAILCLDWHRHNAALPPQHLVGWRDQAGRDAAAYGQAARRHLSGRQHLDPALRVQPVPPRTELGNQGQVPRQPGHHHPRVVHSVYCDAGVVDCDSCCARRAQVRCEVFHL